MNFEHAIDIALGLKESTSEGADRRSGLRDRRSNYFRGIEDPELFLRVKVAKRKGIKPEDVGQDDIDRAAASLYQKGIKRIEELTPSGYDLSEILSLPNDKIEDEIFNIMSNLDDVIASPSRMIKALKRLSFSIDDPLKGAIIDRAVEKWKIQNK